MGSRCDNIQVNVVVDFHLARDRFLIIIIIVVGYILRSTPREHRCTQEVIKNCQMTSKAWLRSVFGDVL